MGYPERIKAELDKFSDPYSEGYAGWCEAFVNHIYTQAGLAFSTSCCANHDRDRFAQDRSPKNGWLVYSGTGYNNVICDNCGRHCGHVGIYWNGNVYGAQKPYKWNFEAWKSYFGYGGCSNQGLWIDDGKIAVDGVMGFETILKLQEKINSPYRDGVLSGQLIGAKPYLKSVTNAVHFDNGCGSTTVKKLQEMVGADADGYWGYNTSKAVQTFLVNAGYSVGPDGIDGYFGPDSVTALQNWLNA